MANFAVGLTVYQALLRDWFVGEPAFPHSPKR